MVLKLLNEQTFVSNVSDGHKGSYVLLYEKRLRQTRSLPFKNIERVPDVEPLSCRSSCTHNPTIVAHLPKRIFLRRTAHRRLKYTVNLYSVFVFTCTPDAEFYYRSAVHPQLRVDRTTPNFARWWRRGIDGLNAFF